MKSGIYCIRNKITQNSYVGASYYVSGRWNQHKSQLRRGKHYSKKMQADHNSYGIDSFEFEILEELPDPRTREDGVRKIEAEQKWIDLIQPTYNGSLLVCKKLGSKQKKANAVSVTKPKQEKIFTVVSVTQESWVGVAQIAEESGCNSVSEFLEKLGRGQINLPSEAA